MRGNTAATLSRTVTPPFTLPRQLRSRGLDTGC
jgi:hypothetical protein